MARPALSPDEHFLKGTRPTRAASAQTSSVAAGRPRCPKTLSADERKEFRAAMRQLEARRVLTPGDGPLLEQFSVLRCRWAEARAYVSAHGAVEEIPILDRQGVTVGYRTEFPKQFQIAQDSEKQLLALTRVLGLTPIDKDKTRPAKLSADEAPVDEAEEFLLSKPEIEATQDPARLN